MTIKDYYVITTSWSTRERLLRRYALPPDKVHVAQPGVDPAQLASGTDRRAAMRRPGQLAQGTRRPVGQPFFRPRLMRVCHLATAIVPAARSSLASPRGSGIFGAAKSPARAWTGRPEGL
jgi:hypothetical protein